MDNSSNSVDVLYEFIPLKIHNQIEDFHPRSSLVALKGRIVGYKGKMGTVLD